MVKSPGRRIAAAFVFSLGVWSGLGAAAAPSWEQDFKSPPPTTKPWVYWYWISDHISREGITHDLEAMAKAGIGEAEIGNVDVTPDDRGAVKALTPEWWSLVEHAVREGKRVGVKVGFFNSPGWSQSGGPWIKPEQSMRYLATSETRVSGPSEFDAKLPAPGDHFQPVAVLAYPSPKGDGDVIAKRKPKVVSKDNGAAAMFDGDLDSHFLLPTTKPGGAQPFEVDLEVSEPFTARSIVLYPGPETFRVECEVQARQPDGTYRTIRSFEVDRRKFNLNVGFLPRGPVAFALPETAATQFRVIFRKAEGKPGFNEIVISSGARLEKYVEKQLAKMFPKPQPDWAHFLWKTQAEVDPAFAVPVDQIRNLTAQTAPDGTLKWSVPPGEWVIARIGMRPTGVTNGPASPEATGLEVDKMNKAAVRDHFDAYFGKLLARLPGFDRDSMGHVVADSYEMGSQNWTDGLEKTFQDTYGYDPIPWLPTLNGRIVGTADQSDRFLWDLRRLVADRIATEYVGGLREKSHENKLELWLENYGHWGFPGEFLNYGGQSDRVSGEFWTSGDLGAVELRDASSAAHIYGKPLVSAEAYTSGGPLWTLDPWALKLRGDWAATEGINHFVLHVYIHQPYDDREPGMNAPFGTEFNRMNTWFHLASGWIDSFRRQHAMLQHGAPVADVLYYIGEDTPKMTGVRDPVLPPGYDFDYINSEVIERDLKVKEGRYVLPNGNSYRLLVLPPQDTMRPAVLAKLESLVAEGGALLGPEPTRSPSLQDFPKADADVSAVAQKLWAGAAEAKGAGVQYGIGRVFTGVDTQSVLDALGVKPDVTGIDPKKALWTHRASADGDAYFVTNQTNGPLEIQPGFRVVGKQPEWWDYVSGDTRLLPAFEQASDRTVVPLQIPPRGAGFVVFRSPNSATTGEGENFPAPKPWQAVDGDWKVSFAGKAPVTFPRLIDWTASKDPDIRNFSGRAVYTKTVELPEAPANSKILLDLGVVNGVASVRLNGQDLGILWADPRRIDATSALEVGPNVLEIEVANAWLNHLIADRALPKDKRTAWMAVNTVKPNAKLLPSGIVGPVAFVRE